MTRKRVLLNSLIALASTVVGIRAAPAGGSHAAGGGTYFVEPGIRSEFQFSQSHVQCKIAHAVLPDGTDFQMLMFSLGVDSVTIDSADGTATIAGSMVSTVTLRFPDGSNVTLSETVPYVAYAEDNGTPGAGVDFFSLSVVYTETPGLDQADLFGSHATFSGALETGNVSIT